MSEKAVQEGIQDAIQSLTGFANADVVINDWTILDQTVASGPYAIIRNSDTFSNDASINTNTTWHVPIEIYEAFTEWDASSGAFRDTRQTVIDAFSGVNRSAGGIVGMLVKDVHSGADVEYYYGPHAEHEELADPIFIAQSIILVCEEF